MQSASSRIDKSCSAFSVIHHVGLGIVKAFPTYIATKQKFVEIRLVHQTHAFHHISCSTLQTYKSKRTAHSYHVLIVLIRIDVTHSDTALAAATKLFQTKTLDKLPRKTSN